MLNLSDEALTNIIEYLDVKSSINLLTCTDAFSDLTSLDIENKLKISRNLSKMYISVEHYTNHGIKSLELAIKNSYFDVLTYLAKELPKMMFIENFDLPEIVNDKQSFHEFYDYFLNYYYPYLKHYINMFCNIAAKYNDTLLISKLVEFDIKNIIAIIKQYALLGDDVNFKKYYELCKYICFHNRVKIHKEDKFLYCKSEKGFKLINNKLIFTKSYDEAEYDDSECYCGYEDDGYGCNKYILCKDILYSAAKGKNMKIIEYLLEKGVNNYEEGLYGAVETNNKVLAEYFIKLSTNGYNYNYRAMEIATKNNIYEMIEFLFKKTKNMCLFERKVPDFYNPINLYLMWNYGEHIDMIFYNQSLERLIELEWDWIIDPIAKFDSSIYEYLIDIAAKKGNFKIFKHCLHFTNNKVNLCYAIEGNNINIIKLCNSQSNVDLYTSLVKAINSKNMDIIEYVYNKFEQIDDINWDKLLIDIYFTENQEWFDWCHENYKQFIGKVIPYKRINKRNRIKISDEDIKRSRQEYEESL